MIFQEDRDRHTRTHAEIIKEKTEKNVISKWKTLWNERHHKQN